MKYETETWQKWNGYKKNSNFQSESLLKEIQKFLKKSFK